MSKTIKKGDKFYVCLLPFSCINDDVKLLTKNAAKEVAEQDLENGEPKTFVVELKVEAIAEMKKIEEYSTILVDKFKIEEDC